MKRKIISGDANAIRIEYYKRDPKLVSVINHLAKQYDVNPTLLLNRLREGFVDNAIRAYNADIIKGNTPKSAIDREPVNVLEALGLDTSHSNIKNGSLKLKRFIPYTVIEGSNVKGKKNYGAQPKTTLDALEIYAAQMSSFRKQIAKEYPHLNDDQLDIFTNAGYNMGVRAAKAHYKRNNLNLTDDGRYGFKRNFKDLDIEGIAASREPFVLERIPNKAMFLPGNNVGSFNINNAYKWVDDSVKRFGGKIRKYGWGGIQNYFDYAKPYLGTANKGSYSDSNGTLNYKTLSNFGSIFFGSDKVNRSINQVIEDKEWDPNKVYVYRQGQGYKSYNELTPEEQSEGNVSQNISVITNDSLIQNLRNHDVEIFNNMQDRIDSDVARIQQVSRAAKFGGLVGYRRKYYTGGSYTTQAPYSGNVVWGTQVKPEDIIKSRYSAKGEGIIGSDMLNYAGSIGGLGAGIGATAGLAAGTALGAWGGPIGLAAGAILGLGIGAITGAIKKKKTEQERREQLAEADEAARQATILNMENRIENDVARIRTFNPNSTFENNSYYGKFGGMVGHRRKMEFGGHIIPNSGDTAVAYGRTHEQVNPMTGQTGITYGDAEVEGGGFVNGKNYPGEVIRKTSVGDQIYSDSLYVPGTRVTYAELAKKLTDKKGLLEKDVENSRASLDSNLDKFEKVRTNKSKTGTIIRNLEKDATLLNRKVGKLAAVESELNDLFVSQEELATGLGLRNTEPVISRFGGVRRKHGSGGFGYNEVGLITNLGTSLFDFIGNEITAKRNKEQLNFMRNLKTPTMSKVDAEYYTTDYDINDQIALATSQYRRNRKFIEDNSSNVQVARNAIRKTDIDFINQISSLKSQQKKYQTERFDLNRNARVQARNMNRQISYNNLLAQYNKDMSYYQALIGINNQAQQNRSTIFNNIGKSFMDYAGNRLYAQIYPNGVKRTLGVSK